MKSSCLTAYSAISDRFGVSFSDLSAALVALSREAGISFRSAAEKVIAHEELPLNEALVAVKNELFPKKTVLRSKFLHGTSGK
jgi:hypothetical protein